MNLTEQVSQFIANPFPLWETTLTRRLVQHQWEELNAKGFVRDEQYNTAGIWLNQPRLEPAKRIKVSESCLHIEMPSSLLNSFYEEHGLELLQEEEIKESQAIAKLDKALSILRLIEPAYACICDLVQSIHILEQPDDEIDLSYSHPQIPFSIFVSVCSDDSTVSNLRVAESILHEAMHLKLTLVESIIPLIKPNTFALYYSPWRGEERPIRGVLHGVFVFKAIMNFYKIFQEQKILLETSHYLSNRIDQIENELDKIVSFSTSAGLTKDGASLAINLLPLS